MIVRTQEWKILLYNVLPPYSKYMSSWALGLFSQKNIVESCLDMIAPSVPVLQHESLLNHVSSVHAHLARRPLHVRLLHLPSMLPKKCISKGIRTLPTGLKTRPPNKSSYKYDSCLEEYPQPYLIRANMKEYSLINESLVSTILS